MRRKGVLLGVILCTVFITNAVFAQGNEVVTQVKEAVKAGSAKELSKYLNQTVDVTIESKLQNYSKPQAEFVLRDFFKAHPPTDFSLIHEGQSKAGQPYAIGQYKSGADVYRFWIKIKTVGKQQLIYEISFSKE